jgi:hypothetical protein
VYICPCAAWLEDYQLAALRALTHAFAGPIIVTHDLPGAEE